MLTSVGRDTLGEVVAGLRLVVTGARTELTETTPLVVLYAPVVLDPAWTSPSPSPPSSSLLAAEEDMTTSAGEEEEESCWTRPVPRQERGPARATAEEEQEQEVTSLGPASSYWR